MCNANMQIGYCVIPTLSCRPKVVYHFRFLLGIMKRFASFFFFTGGLTLAIEPLLGPGVYAEEGVSSLSPVPSRRIAFNLELAAEDSMNFVDVGYGEIESDDNFRVLLV